MKKYNSILLSLILGFGLSACRNGQNSPIDNNPESTITGTNHVLVAYFSYSGNTQTVARVINEQLESDIFRIVVSEPYTDETIFDRAQEEVNSKSFPEISTHIEKDTFSSYDTVIIGFPIWWYDLPRPVATFVNEYDFTGKTVIPFFTHNGSSSGASSLSTLGTLVEGANYRRSDSLSLRGSSVSNSTSTITSWVKSLNL